MDRIVLERCAAGRDGVTERHSVAVAAGQPSGRIGSAAAACKNLRGDARAVHVEHLGWRRPVNQHYARGDRQIKVCAWVSDLERLSGPVVAPGAHQRQRPGRSRSLPLATGCRDVDYPRVAHARVALRDDRTLHEHGRGQIRRGRDADPF